MLGPTKKGILGSTGFNKQTGVQGGTIMPEINRGDVCDLAVLAEQVRDKELLCRCMLERCDKVPPQHAMPS